MKNFSPISKKMVLRTNLHFLKMRHYDYIIAGSGLAGLYTAYHAAAYGKVALLTKSGITESNSYLHRVESPPLQTKTMLLHFTSRTQLLPDAGFAITQLSIF